MTPSLCRFCAGHEDMEKPRFQLGVWERNLLRLSWMMKSWTVWLVCCIQAAKSVLWNTSTEDHLFSVSERVLLTFMSHCYLLPSCHSLSHCVCARLCEFVFIGSLGFCITWHQRWTCSVPLFLDASVISICPPCFCILLSWPLWWCLVVEISGCLWELLTNP